MGSPFASLTVSDRIPLPFDDGQWIRVRKLTGRECERAQEAHRDGLVDGSLRLWAVTFRRALEQGASDPEVLRAIRDPLTGYDRFALVRDGLVEWSYPLRQPIPASPAVKNADGSITPAVEAYDPIEDLDDEAVDFIATEVLRLTKPGLFHATEAEAEAEKKTPDAVSSIAGARAGLVATV
jgi:hypothetical protein